MPGVDPNLAFMGVVVVATAGLGFSVHTVRGILERLHAAERAADRAKAEAMLYRSDQGYAGTLADYRAALADYERVVPKPVAPVRKKKAPAPPRKAASVTIARSRIDWSPPVPEPEKVNDGR